MTADDTEPRVRGANPALTATFTGFKNGETLATSDVTGCPVPARPRRRPPARSTGSPLRDHCVLGTLASGNYNFTFVDGQLTVTKATLTVTADDTSRVRGANPALTATITGFKNGETLATSGVTGSPVLHDHAHCLEPGHRRHRLRDHLRARHAGRGQLQLHLRDGKLTVTKATLTVTADDTSPSSCSRLQAARPRR